MIGRSLLAYLYITLIYGAIYKGHPSKIRIFRPSPRVSGLNNILILKITIVVRNFMVFLDPPPPGELDVTFGWSLICCPSQRHPLTNTVLTPWKKSLKNRGVYRKLDQHYAKWILNVKNFRNNKTHSYQQPPKKN